MEPLFAVRMTHDEDMYYNQVLASKQSAPAEKPGKKNFLSRVDLSDVIFGLLAFTSASFLSIGLMSVVFVICTTSCDLKKQGFKILLLPNKLMHMNTVIHKAP